MGTRQGPGTGAERLAGVPPVSYPPELPITARVPDIRAAVRDHQVVVVAGETGSGKSTQLPKLCLELGRGGRGMVGHTQPRRLAARAVAERVAQELGTPLGGVVGYQVRFNTRVGTGTLVKVMTDGILLAEIQRDRWLRAYDTVIVDEAHERSLNLDFLLGYLKRVLPRRPDLKVIVTSATIDPERFAAHFGGAPVIEVSGRAWPVEVRYRPLDATEDGEDDRDQAEAACDAVEELAGHGPGDVLVFLSGEREIRDTAAALRRRNLPGTEILPLYARLASAEQRRVFQPHRGRRVVLATNVAETSLTVPGIRYVVDAGTARISRYSQRTKVQRLPIEPVSQASATQRAGRCGRTGPGVCIRLYDEQDFLARPTFTEPEVLRTNLASVILQMTALGIGEVTHFPFMDAPDRRQVADGVRLLEELGALAPGRRLTPLGRTLARLPVDPRLARMLVEAAATGGLDEALVIVAALAIPDPRERPAEERQQADERHRRFADPDSDFVAYLNLWRYLKERQEELSSNQFRRLCRAEHLHYLRVREWQDLVGQLRSAVREAGLRRRRSGGSREALHRALLAGLLSHVGCKDGAPGEYQGARGARFAIFPGSGLFKRSPRWVMAAELVETSRLWARTVARIEPEWAEELGTHLVRRSYSEPRWDPERGAVVASEKVTLFGVPLVAGRTVDYGRIDPALARELFIRGALVEGRWHTRHRFDQHNRRLLAEVEELERRARRHDLRVSDQALFELYDQRVGREAVSARHFDTWWKRAAASQPDLLSFDRSMLVNQEAGVPGEHDFPDWWRQGRLRLRLAYRFEPGSPADGVTVLVPLHLLNQVRAEGFEWLVPGLREELVTALVRSLPKQLRRHLAPAPEHARAALERLRPGDGPLLEALSRELGRRAGVEVPAGAFQPSSLPGHLRFSFRVTDRDGRTLAEGGSLEELKLRLREPLRAALAGAAGEVEREGLAGWDLGTLPRVVERQRGGATVTAYPALVDEGERGVAVRLLESEEEQRRAMWRGTRRLLLDGMPSPLKGIVGRLPRATKRALSFNPHGGAAPLLADCTAAATDELIAEQGGPAWDADAYAKLHDRVRAELADRVERVIAEVARVLDAAQAVENRLEAAAGHPLLTEALADVRAQRSALVHPGFVTATGTARLGDLLRYLRAADRRLEKLPQSPHRDREHMEALDRLHRAYQQRLDALPPGQPPGEQLAGVRWMLEELRVSLFAQHLGTPYPISEQRVVRALGSG